MQQLAVQRYSGEPFISAALIDKNLTFSYVLGRTFPVTKIWHFKTSKNVNQARNRTAFSAVLSTARAREASGAFEVTGEPPTPELRTLWLEDSVGAATTSRD